MRAHKRSASGQSDVNVSATGPVLTDVKAGSNIADSLSSREQHGLEIEEEVFSSFFVCLTRPLVGHATL